VRQSLISVLQSLQSTANEPPLQLWKSCSWMTWESSGLRCEMTDEPLPSPVPPSMKAFFRSHHHSFFLLNSLIT